MQDDHFSSIQKDSCQMSESNRYTKISQTFSFKIKGRGRGHKKAYYSLLEAMQDAQNTKSVFLTRIKIIWLLKIIRSNTIWNELKQS